MRYARVIVLIPDTPPSWARLFNDVGQAGINLEELVLEHALGARSSAGWNSR